MQLSERIDRLREELVVRGERRAATAIDATDHHTDFSDFSEKSGPGDREPNFTDFVDRS